MIANAWQGEQGTKHKKTKVQMEKETKTKYRNEKRQDRNIIQGT